MKLTQPDIHTGLAILLNKLIILKKLTPVAPPLSHWCLLLLTTQISLFSFPEISMQFCCDKRVSILDRPHQFPRCETTQIWRSPGKHYSAHLSSLHLLRRDWCMRGVVVVEERKWIVSRGNFWREGRIKLLMYLEIVTHCCVLATAGNHFCSAFELDWGSWAMQLVSAHTAQVIKCPPIAATALSQV